MEHKHVSPADIAPATQTTERVVAVARLDDGTEQTIRLQLPDQLTHGKLTKSDKALVSANWQAIREFAGGEDASANDLRAPVRNVLDQLTSGSRFELSMKRSFEKRLEAVQRQEWVEEIRTTNSPWSEVLDLAKDRVHGENRSTAKDRFAENYMATSVLALKAKVSQFTEQHPRADIDAESAKGLLERKITDLYKGYLSGLTEGESKGMRFRDVLASAAEREFGEKLSVEKIIERIGSDIETEVIEVIPQLTAADIGNDEVYTLPDLDDILPPLAEDELRPLPDLDDIDPLPAKYELKPLPDLDDILPPLENSEVSGNGSNDFSTLTYLDFPPVTETHAAVEQKRLAIRSITNRMRRISGREAVGGILKALKPRRRVPDEIESADEVTDTLDATSSASTPRLNRRQLLKLTAAAVAIKTIPPAVSIGMDPEFRAGVEAALARPEVPGNGERHEVSESVLLEVYKKHFRGKEHLLPQESWVRTEPPESGELRGNGVHLGILAQHCYDAEKMDREDFDTYYKRFVDSMHAFADQADLDFTTLVTTLQISAENITGYEKPKERSNMDVNVSRFQEVMIPVSRVLGVEDELLETLGPGGIANGIRDEVGSLGGSSLDEALPDGGIRHYDLIRFRQQPTTGIMDMEPGERAEAFRLFQGNPLIETLQEEFPEICDTYNNVNEKRDEVTAVREELRSEAERYIASHAESLHPFAAGDQEALEAIGISQSMDLWQLQNYTDAWYKVSELPTNPEFGYRRTVEYMQQEAQKDPEAFYRRFFSQQVRNPKFLSYMMRAAIESGSHEELEQLARIQELTERYEDTAKDLRVAHLNTLEAEGPHEYNSRFQQMASVLLTKRLSEIAGDFDPNDRDSLGWHIYKTSAIREIAPMTALVNDDVFARDITIDTPYAQETLAKSLDTFSDMLEGSGMLGSSPDGDMNAAYNTFEKMFWRDGGVWPDVPEAQWERILEHFDKNLVNRMFYDFTGLFGDEEKMAELNGMMLSNGIITQPAEEDPYNFFKQFVYLSVNSPHMRPDIPKEEWDEVHGYFQANIMPRVITNEEVAPGVFREKWNIGSADYPPIFRAQAVMYNFFVDQNEEPPASPSSAEIVGHH